jgi:hypothetical protein
VLSLHSFIILNMYSLLLSLFLAILVELGYAQKKLLFVDSLEGTEYSHATANPANFSSKNAMGTGFHSKTLGVLLTLIS